MKITEKLILKYYSGQCSAEERKFVEQWMESTEDEKSSYSDETIAILKKDTWVNIVDANKKSFTKADRQFHGQEAQHNSPQKGRTIMLTVPSQINKVARMGIAACIAFLLFGAGYYTALQNTNIPETIVVDAKDIKTNSDKLVMTSANGHVTELSGTSYEIELDGVVKLRNGSPNQKILNCGNKTYVLEPSETYYLNASKNNSFMYNANRMVGAALSRIAIKGDYSIRTIDVRS